MDYIKNRYMGPADDLMMIYVPMHIGHHWYLMIIEIWDRKLVYLDSFKSDDVAEIELRLRQMKDVAKYVEEMLRDKSFWEAKDTMPPFVADYEPEIPFVGSKHLAQWTVEFGFVNG
ncbi:hypothetical protein PIB30_037642 [Stylosanthes scabra]|uniref:Ubiquitin-like protease family profile domain-containing protein n=1 Tax=Stylosanthes scabra TaxID=79078 RepID=A0ABU6RDU8_9FABA|nr:hypothetical protein [Stylosanthes scabra]